MMLNPIFESASPSDFWGRRWNLVVHGLLKRYEIVDRIVTVHKTMKSILTESPLTEGSTSRFVLGIPVLLLQWQLFLQVAFSTSGCCQVSEQEGQLIWFFVLRTVTFYFDVITSRISAAWFLPPRLAQSNIWSQYSFLCMERDSYRFGVHDRWSCDISSTEKQSTTSDSEFIGHTDGVAHGALVYIWLCEGWLLSWRPNRLSDG